MKRFQCLFIVGFFFFLPSKLFAEKVPGLGSAGSFAFFSANGPVIDTGQSRITGNIGTNNGTISGFENVYGELHNANERTISAANDLLILYHFLNSATPTHHIDPLIGNGDTLTPGVYSSKGGLMIKNILYLDTKGDTNAIFIFQISGTFSSESSAKVKLLNGAQASNIFWMVDGETTFGPDSYMMGNIIANNGDIIFSLNDTLEGRALTTKGAVKVNKLVTFGDMLDVPTVPLDGGLWMLLGVSVVYAGVRLKKQKYAWVKL